MSHQLNGIFAPRGLRRISDVLHGREFALIAASRPAAEWLHRFLDWYTSRVLNRLGKVLLHRVPSWLFNFVFWLLRAGKANLLLLKLRYVLNDPTGCADHPEWENVL